MVMKHQRVLQPLPDYARQRTTVSNVRTRCTISINNIGVRYTTYILTHKYKQNNDSNKPAQIYNALVIKYKNSTDFSVSIGMYE